MHTDVHKSEIDRVTEKIIGCAFTVGNRLGCGFLEKVYENALVIELRRAGLHIAQQQLMKVLYDEVVVGTYLADVVVEDSVLVEIKAVKLLDEIHSAQCLNYLKAIGLSLCLLINFGRPRVDIKHIVCLCSSYQRLSVFIRGSITQARRGTLQTFRNSPGKRS